MASGSDIFQALMQAQTQPAQTPYGFASTTLAGAVPNLVNPYGSTGNNLAITAGAGLVSALLGGLARREAAQDNATLAPLFRQFSTATPEQQSALLKQEPRLAALQNAMLSDQMNRANSVETATAISNAQLPIDLRKAQAQQVLQLLGEQGKTINAQGQEEQIFDPIAQKAAETKATKLAEREVEGIGNALSPKDIANLEIDTANKIASSPESKGFADVNSNWEAMKKLSSQKSQAASVGMITAAAKALDPGAVVRENDFSILANPGSPAAQLQSYLTTIKGEGKLTADQKKSLLSTVKEFTDSRYQGYSNLANSLIGTGRNQGLTPEHINLMPKPDLNIPYVSDATTPQDLISELKASGLPREQAQQIFMQMFPGGQ